MRWRRLGLISLDDHFRYPKCLRRVLNQERFTVEINRDFKAVVALCSMQAMLFPKNVVLLW